MSSLSGKQVGEIKNLYESIYTEETVDETVEVSYDEYSDEELLELFVEEVANEVLATLYENEYLSEKFVLDERSGINLGGFFRKVTGIGAGRRMRTAPELKLGKGKVRNTYPDKTDVKRGRVTPGREVGSLRRTVTGGTLASMMGYLANTPIGKSIQSRLGGGAQGFGQGFMQDPKSDNKPKSENGPKNDSGIYLDKDGTIKYK